MLHNISNSKRLYGLLCRVLYFDIIFFDIGLPFDGIVTIKAMVSSDLQNLCGKEKVIGNGEGTNEEVDNHRSGRR